MLMLLAPPPNAEVHRRHARVIERAILAAYKNIGAACIDMNVDQGNFANALAGNRPLQYRWLMRLNKEFWQWYPVYLSQEFGIPGEIKHAVRFVLGIAGKRRMAKMLTTVRGAVSRRQSA